MNAGLNFIQEFESTSSKLLLYAHAFYHFAPSFQGVTMAQCILQMASCSQSMLSSALSAEECTGAGVPAHARTFFF